MLHAKAEADGTAPVLHHERHVAQVEVKREGGEVLDVAGERIGLIERLIRLAEAHVVRDDAAVGLRERRNEVAIKVAPGGVAVEHDDRLAFALIDVVEADAVVLKEDRRERPRPAEGLVGQVWHTFLLHAFPHSCNGVESKHSLSTSLPSGALPVSEALSMNHFSERRVISSTSLIFGESVPADLP